MKEPKKPLSPTDENEQVVVEKRDFTRSRRKVHRKNMLPSRTLKERVTVKKEADFTTNEPTVIAKEGTSHLRKGEKTSSQ